MKWFRHKKPNRRMTSEDPPHFRWRKGLGYAASGLAVVVLIAGVSIYLRGIEWERFRALEVTGDLQRVSAAEVHAILQPYIASGFARIDMHAAQEALESLPWIASAKVRRQWPGTLVVWVREERPVATWFGTSLMNADGEVFVDGAAGYFGKLPDVGGPPGTQDDMILRLEEIRAVMKAEDLELRRLLRTERRAERFWVSLADGAVIEVRLGRRDTDTRLRRFLKAAWPALAEQSEKINYIDMRYTNGFTVGWKAAHGKSRQERG